MNAESLRDVFERIAKAAEKPPGSGPEQGLLATALDAAVPLWMMRLKDRDPAVLIRRAGECAQIVAEKGDVILYRSKVKGETAAAFNALAEGIAILALVAPGGVRIFGRTWTR